MENKRGRPLNARPEEIFRGETLRAILGTPAKKSGAYGRYKFPSLPWFDDRKGVLMKVKNGA